MSDEQEPTNSDEVAILEIEDSIDLHGFQPRDIPDVVQDYLEEAAVRGFREVRLIHGRGKGVQRARIQSLLSRHPRVEHFSDAPATRGGWGATLVTLTVSAPSDFDGILARYAPGSRLLRCFELKGGISARMTALEFERLPKERDAVVVRQLRWGTPQSREQVLARELQTLELARDLDLPAPRPRGFDSQGEPALLLEYIDALPDFSPPSVSAMTAEMARVLRQIHQVEGADPRLAFLPRSAEQAAATLATPPEKLDESLGEARIRAALAAAGPAPRPNPVSLLHGDYWPGNLLWKSDRLAAVVDWEEAAVGDPLFDLAIARLDLLFAFGWDALHGFTEQYREQSNLDWAGLPWWDLRVALRPMGNLARWAEAYKQPSIRRPDVTEPAMRKAHQAFVEQALSEL